MNRSLNLLATIVFATVAGSALAHNPTDTDDARAIAAQSTAQQVQASLFRAPVADSVALGDYRAAAANQTREAQHRSLVAAVRAYDQGERSQPLAVNSEDTARAEAQRARQQHDIGRQAGVLQAAVPTGSAIQ